jgi:hypothetical protein
VGNGQGAPPQERAFVQIALGSNAAEDKVRASAQIMNNDVSSGRSLKWPKPYDEAFMHRGIALAPRLIVFVAFR